MNESTNKQRVKRAALTFLISVPASVFTSLGLVYGLGPSAWGNFQTVLHAAFRSIGLAGIPYEFPWAWMTVFFLQIAVPYGAIVTIVHHLLGQWASGTTMKAEPSPRWPLLIFLVFVAAPFTLILSKGWYSLGQGLPIAWPDVAISDMSRVVDFIGLFLVLAVPFAVLCVSAYELSRRRA